MCEANPNTVVVLANGAPVEMPWVEAPNAILEAYLGGQAGGSAIADLLFGLANPSGKLAETFPLRQTDTPADQWFPGAHRQVHYREGLYVGYRYFDTAAAAVLFPFGHGLSYTQFEFSNLSISRDTLTPGNELLVSVQLKNVGNQEGAEVVQLYVSDLTPSTYRPKQALRAFTKVMLRPQEERTVTLQLDDAAFAAYDTEAQAWVVESGEFELRVGASSRDIRLKHRLTMRSDQQVSEAQRTSKAPEFGNRKLDVTDATFASMLGKPVPPPESSRPYHLNSSISEIAESWLGERFRKRVVAGFQKTMGANSNNETTKKMFEEMANNMPLRSLALLGAGNVSSRSLEILVAVLNRQFITALRLMIARRPE